MDWDRLRRAERAQRAEHKEYERELRLALWQRILAGAIVLLALGAALAVLLTR
jgi:hypothetical protein